VQKIVSLVDARNLAREGILICPPDAERIAHTMSTALETANCPESIFGDGNAGACIVEALPA